MVFCKPQIISYKTLCLFLLLKIKLILKKRSDKDKLVFLVKIKLFFPIKAQVIPCETLGFSLPFYSEKS